MRQASRCTLIAIETEMRGKPCPECALDNRRAARECIACGHAFPGASIIKAARRMALVAFWFAATILFFLSITIS